MTGNRSFGVRSPPQLQLSSPSPLRTSSSYDEQTAQLPQLDDSQGSSGSSQSSILLPDSSPSHTHSLPFANFSSPPSFAQLPSKTAAAVRAHRANFFTSSSTTSKHSSRAHARDLTSSSPPLATTSSQQELFRSRFRQACQAHMARDRARTVAQVRGVALADVQSPPSLRGGIGLGRRRMPHVGSDELDRLASSDDEGDSQPHWAEQDEELMRHIILAEYRRQTRLRESEGRRVLDWLNADEIDYLEAELQREEAEHLSTPRASSRKHCSTARHPPRTPARGVDGPAIPPQDLEDAELEFYADLFAQQQTQGLTDSSSDSATLMESEANACEDEALEWQMWEELDRVEAEAGVLDVDMG